LIGCELSSNVLAVGVDLDESALAFGRGLNRGISFVRARGEELPFENESFDLVISRVALPYMEITKGLAEMSRVLSPGADLWIVLHPLSTTLKELISVTRGLHLKGFVFRSWVLLNGLSFNVFGRQYSWPLDPNRHESWQANRRMIRLLHQAGFTDIRITRDKHFVITARKAAS
jgi:ubiquinone/menaquinone biosynthesis C-methylase UbiE